MEESHQISGQRTGVLITSLPLGNVSLSKLGIASVDQYYELNFLELVLKGV